MKAVAWHGKLDVRVDTFPDPLGVESFATHRLPLEEAPRAYELFQKKQDER